LTGNSFGHLFGDSLRKHAGDRIGTVAEGFDELVRIALADLCDRVLGNCVSAAISNGIAIDIRAKTRLVPRVSDKPNFVATDTRDRSE
jgi:hypothetical protein